MKKFYLFVLMAAMLQVSTLMDAQVRYPDSRAGLMNPQQRVVAANGHETYVDGDGASITNADGTLYFSTMDLAIQSIQAGDVVTLKALEDATVTKELNVTNGMFVTLDLNGKELIIQNYMDVNYSGTSAARLDIVDLSGTNNGKLKFNGKSYYLYIEGAQTDQSDFSVLNIGAGVTISQDDYYALAVFNRGKITQNGKEVGPAFGVKIDIYGTVISKSGLSISGNVQALGENVPTITIKEGGRVVVGDTNAAIYAAGYGNWIIEGTVQGGTGVYAKAGNVTVQGDGKVVATAATYTVPEPYGNGYKGGYGCAIVQDSKNGYAGGMTLIVKDNATIESQTSDGYAIKEIKTDALNTKTESIVIEGGTIKGNLDTTAELKDVIIANGTITGGTFDTDVTEYLNNITGVITPVPGENGKTIYVVGEKPVSAPDWINDINAATAASYVRLNGNGEQTLTKDIEAKYLVMQGADDKVVVPAGKTLSVGEVVMGANAVIEVEAGATLIVNDENGIVANSATNIVVATAEDNPGMVLINPAVTSNKSPKATVEFMSNSYKKEDNSYIYQFFGSPMKEVTSITSSSATYKAQLDIWNVNKFEPMGIINGDEAVNYSKFSVPFAFISMLSNNPENEKQTFTMEGRLYGIDEPVLPIYAEWSGMSNAYMGAIDIVALEAANVAARNNGSNVDISIYTYKQQGNKLVWTANNELQRTTLKINPMQPFMMYNNGDMENRTLGYEDLVWTPATYAQAPARRNIASDMTKTTLRVNAENGLFDLLTVAEASSFTAGRDMYDAVKYMNSDINFYITDTEKMNILATDNLDNTYLGFSCIEAGNYTISFENVEGSTLTLIDLANNTAIDMTEGATYTFAAAANESNDYRFKLVNRRDVVTGVEDVENAEVRGGIYTLTGQYMGEMNVWNTLPAGIYVVNGEKRVK